MKSNVQRFLNALGYTEQVDQMIIARVGEIRDSLKVVMGDAKMDDNGSAPPNSPLVESLVASMSRTKSKAEQYAEIIEHGLRTRREAVDQEIEQLYMDVYTEDELAKLVDFYETPLGKKLIETGVMVTQRVGDITQQWFFAAVKEVEAELEGIFAAQQAQELSVNDGEAEAEK